LAKKTNTTKSYTIKPILNQKSQVRNLKSFGHALRKSSGQAIRCIPDKKNYGQKKPCFSKSGDAAPILHAKRK